MSPWGDLLRRVRGDRRSELERQVEEELLAHLDLLVEEHLAAGMSPEAAEAHAHRRLGDLRRLRKEGVRIRRGNGRQARRRSILADFAADARIALRCLGRDPSFTAVAVVTLALGIGAAAAVFSVLDAVLLKPLPYPEPDQLVVVREYQPNPRFARLWSVSPANLADWQERNRVFTGIAPINGFPTFWVNLAGRTEPVRTGADRVTTEFFEVLGVGAALGRVLAEEDDTPGAPPVVVLSHSLWTRTFGGDPGVVGRTLRLDEEDHTVIGVMPEGFFYGDETGPDLWRNGAIPADTQTERRSRTLDPIARLAPGVTLERAQAEMDAIALQLAEAYPDANRDSQTGQPWGVRLLPMHDRIVEDVRPSLLVLGGGVALVLLIAWINVTNLLAARVVARRREFAVRTAMGAGRGRVARQVLTEALVLSAAGGLAGLAIARALVLLFGAAAPAPGGGATGLATGAIPLLSRAEIGPWVVAMTTLTCLVTTGACGLGPMLRAARTQIREGLTASGPRGGGGRDVVSKLLVALEIALSLVLLIGVGLLVDTMHSISDIPTGFKAEGAQVLRAPLTRERYAALVEGEAGTASARWRLRPERTAVVDHVLSQTRALPTVEAAGAINILPFQDPYAFVYGGSIHLEGAERESLRELEGVAVHGFAGIANATPGYFEAMGIPLLAGRTFVESDREGAPVVAIVNRELLDSLEITDPIGRRIKFRDSQVWRDAEIVGVVENVLQFGYYSNALRNDLRSLGIVYLPFAQSAPLSGRFFIDFHTTLNVVARHRGEGEAVGLAMRDIFREADPETPISFVGSLEGYMAENLADRRFQMLLIGALAAVALVLALVGAYGVMAFQVGRRIHEIGVRMAVGAPRGDVATMIVGEGARVAVAGALLGVLAGVRATRLLAPWLYGVGPTDPAVFATLSALMVGVAVVACWVPARRAARVDPIEALRAE